MDPRYLDHFEHPRNVGDLADPHGRATVENPVCGDVIQVAIRVAADRLSEVRVRVQGCSAAIAAASAMSELATGRSLVEVAAVDRDAIDAALGGLPALKRHGADLAADGLQAVLEDARRARGGST